MHNQEITAINLHNEVELLEKWVDDNPSALSEDIIHVRTQIICKRVQLGLLRFKIRENAINYQTTETSR